MKIMNMIRYENRPFRKENKLAQQYIHYVCSNIYFLLKASTLDTLFIKATCFLGTLQRLTVCYCQ